MELSDNHNPVKFRTALLLASYAVVFSVAPPLSPHKRLWGKRGNDTKNDCIGGYIILYLLKYIYAGILNLLSPKIVT